MSTIKSLPSSTIKIIKSSQVILSIASVVKELVENALDAEATIINVKLENGGLQKIEVRDNGQGLDPEDVQVMAQPHYTSKIQTHDDLQRLSTYGFRGEALAAVCNVSNFSVVTKREQDESSTTYTMNPNGEVKEQKISNLGKGTSVIVENIFKNLPVRRKQLQESKRCKNELKLTEDLLLAYTLIHPTLYVTLHHNHHIIWQKPRTTTLNDSLAHHFSRPVAQHLSVARNNDSNINVELYLPLPSAPIELCFRQKPDRLFLYVNKRPVIDKDLIEFVKELYGSSWGSTRDPLFPVGVIIIEAPACSLDVNLEPSKTRVLFANKDCVKNLIRNTLQTQWVHIPVPTRSEPALPVNPDRIIESVKHRVDISNPLGPELSTNQRANAEIEAFQSHNTISDTFGNKKLEEADLDRGFPFAKMSATAKRVSPIPEKGSNSHAGLQTSKDHAPFEFALPFRSTTPSAGISVEMDSWSRGTAKLNGQTINPVGLVRGGSSMPRDTESAPPPKRSKLSLFSSRQPTLDSFDAWFSDRVPSPAVSLPPRQNPIPVAVFESAASRTLMDYFPGETRKPNRDEKEKPVQARATPRALRKQGITDRKEIPALKKSTALNFCLDNLKNQAHVEEQPRKLVGKVNEGFWVVNRDNSLSIWNHSRMQEVVLYRHLLAEFELPSEEHQSVFPTMDANLLGSKLWSLVLSLESEFESETTSVVTDKRLVCNGYSIRIEEDGTPFAIVLSGPPDLEEIKEILQCIARNPKCTVEEARTLRAKQYCQEEAVRQSQVAQLSSNDAEEFAELLEAYLELRSEYPNQVSCCLHERLVETSLGCLDDITGYHLTL